MNRLFDIMAEDMGIEQYSAETEESFGYRIIYSALGLWCLTSALSEKDKGKEISKNALSIILHRLTEQYLQILPEVKKYLYSSRAIDIAVHIRNLYEQTGYLITLDNNFDVLNNSGETVKVSQTDNIYLGLPATEYTVNGLGIHCKEVKKEISLNEFLIRDNLSLEKYLMANFDECDFTNKDISKEELEFFDPLSRGRFSEAWRRDMNVDMTIARRNVMGPYYRVLIDASDKLVVADEISSGESDSITGAEYRRLYSALRQYYRNPMSLLVCPIDEEYSHIKILGQIPNREYFYLLLNAWPKNGFSDRNNFIIRNELLTQTVKILNNIGFVMRKGEFYG